MRVDEIEKIDFELFREERLSIYETSYMKLSKFYHSSIKMNEIKARPIIVISNKIDRNYFLAIAESTSKSDYNIDNCYKMSIPKGKLLVGEPEVRYWSYEILKINKSILLHPSSSSIKYRRFYEVFEIERYMKNLNWNEMNKITEYENK